MSRSSRPTDRPRVERERCVRGEGEEGSRACVTRCPRALAGSSDPEPWPYLSLSFPCLPCPGTARSLNSARELEYLDYYTMILEYSIL